MFDRPKLRRWLPIVGLPVVVAAGLLGIGVYRDTHPESEVTRLWRVLELKPGMAIAEIGAGEGKMTVSMARQLGPGGRVVATEVDPARLRDIVRAVAKAGLRNVRIIRGGDRATNLSCGYGREPVSGAAAGRASCGHRFCAEPLAFLAEATERCACRPWRARHAEGDPHSGAHPRRVPG